MRVTLQTKQETESAILAVASRLFASKGLEATSTRDLAAAAGIATGTLFNYFSSKEALAVSLVARALDTGREHAKARINTATGTVDEDLYTLIAYATRALEPMRSYVGEVLEAGLSPLTPGALMPEAEHIRRAHLEDVAGVLRKHHLDGAGVPTMHLYWALFLSVLAYWSADRSPLQEDTRALIDQTVRMFTASLVSIPHTPSAAIPSIQGVTDGR